MNNFSVYFVSLFLACNAASAGNCLVQGNKKIGDCENVNVGPTKPLTVVRSGTFSGNFGAVTVRAGASASINGNTGDVLVEKRASLQFTGNAQAIRVFGIAEIDGNADRVIAESGSEVVIRGIVGSVSGSGKVSKAKGAIVNGEFIRQ